MADIFSKEHRALENDPEGRPLAGPLFHYTSLEGLQGIVNEKALRATSVHYLNDASESALGTGLLYESAIRAKQQAAGIDEEFLEFFLDVVRTKLLVEVNPVFVLCFSEVRNQLSQWRSYSQHGRGVCIAFDAKLLVERMQALGWTFQPCRYGIESQRTYVEAILSRLRREATENPPPSAADRSAHFRAVCERCMPAVLQVVTYAKHKAFAEEREWRFISPPIDSADPRVAFRVGRTTLMPYVQFGLVREAGQPLEFDEVIIGPSPTEDLSRSSVMAFLTRHGARVRKGINLSEIPYREL